MAVDAFMERAAKAPRYKQDCSSAVLGRNQATEAYLPLLHSSTFGVGLEVPTVLLL